MATYTHGDFEQIASAIRKDLANIYRYQKQFEAAAMWYRLDLKAPKKQTPFIMRRRMTQIVWRRPESQYALCYQLTLLQAE